MEDLLSRHRGGSLLVDTNLLVLLFVGGFERGLVGRHKRTIGFALEDYDLLLRFIKLVPNVVTTPHILAEVNSLSGQMGEPKRSEYFRHFASSIRLLDEHFISSESVTEHVHFPKIGLTDSIILALATLGPNVGSKRTTDRLLVLTDDYRLSNYLDQAGADYLNFNHIRTLNWT